MSGFNRIGVLLFLVFALANSQAQSPSALTNADVLKLVSAGVPDATTIAAIEQARQHDFDVSVPAITALKRAGVPEPVIAVMQRVSPPPPPAPTPIAGQASSLVGLTPEQVRSQIGAPTNTSNDIWYFDSSVGTLRVYMKHGVVIDVNPADFALSAFTGRVGTNGGSSANSSGAAASTGSIVCRDGTMSQAANRQGACSGHGGISGSTAKKKKR